MASNPMMQGMGPAGPQGAGAAAPGPEAGIAHFIAQLAAMPPKQAAQLLQMQVAQAQAQGDQQQVQLLTAIGQKLNAALAQGEGDGGGAAPNPVSQMFGAQFGG